MPIERLPESVQTLYAELLDQATAADAEARAERLPPPGTFVVKQVKGRRYWYLQRSEAGRKRQYYLGPESAPLIRWMERVEGRRDARAPDAQRRAELVSMLSAGGAIRERSDTARVVRVLAEIGVFRLGGVLVGTQAFTCYANLLGVRFEGRSVRTEDVDVAQDPAVPVAVDPQAVPADLEQALRSADHRFLAVPALDPRHPSTSFKVRGRDLRVDLLTPQRRGRTTPVELPHLGAAAQPLPFLEYLIEGAQPAVVLEGSGILVRVPEPARFVFHKLWLAGERPSAEQVRARKDLRQAAQVAEVLRSDRPHDLAGAWEAVERSRRSQVRASIERLEDAVADPLGELTGFR